MGSLTPASYYGMYSQVQNDSHCYQAMDYYQRVEEDSPAETDLCEEF